MRNRNQISLLPLLIMLAIPFLSHALNWNSSSVLNSGKWVKVKVTDTGIQEISYDDLRQMGFSNPENVAVFGYSGSQLSHNNFKETDPDDLPAVPVIRNGNRLLFYGESNVHPLYGKSLKIELERNHYSTAGYYFLTDSRRSAEPRVIEYNANAGSHIDSHNSLLYRSKMNINPVNSGVYFFSRNLIKKEELPDIIFSLKDRVEGTSATYNGLILINEGNGVAVDVNGTENYNKRLNSKDYVTHNIPSTSIDPSFLDNESSVRLTLRATGAETSFLGYNYIALGYTRHNRMGNNAQLRMTVKSSTGNNRFRFPAETFDDLQVWNVTNPNDIGSYELVTEYDEETGQTGTLLYLASRCSSSTPSTHTHLVAFRPGATQHKPVTVGDVPNQDLHALDTPDMLIITTAECRQQAERLAQLHRDHQNLDVQVVLHEDIFNEFSSGAPTPMAYRRIAKMFYDRDPRKFRHLLLFGSATYDNCRLLEANREYTPDRMLLSYQIEDPALQFNDDTSLTTDTYFGMVHDNATGDFMTATEKNGYHNMLITVGRIPANSFAEAATYVDKAEKYLVEGLSAQAQTRAVVFTDDGDKDIHIISGETFCAYLAQLLPYTVISRAHDGIYPWEKGVAREATRRIVNSLSEGASIFYYSGHGRSDCFTSENLWTRNIVNDTRYSQYPFTMFMSCNAFGFDRHENSIAESALFTTDGGTVALMSAARSVFNDENLAFSLKIAKEMSEAGPGDTFGDIFRKARNVNFYERSYLAARATTNAYIFGGDPALPVFRPAEKVELLSLNGSDGTGAITIDPLRPNSIRARITDRAGNPLPDYDGKVTISIYEPVYKTPNLYSDGASAAQQVLKEIDIEDDLLFRTVLPVKNGIVSGEITVPPTSQAGAHRMVLAAECDGDLYRHAAGVVRDIAVAPVDPDLSMPDVEKPVISAIYLNNESFSDGDLVAPDPVLHASIKASNGSVNLNGSSIAPALKLTLDNMQSFPALRYHAATTTDGVISVEFPLEMHGKEGRHSLTLSVSDIFGNETAETIRFQIVNTTADLTVIPDRKIASDEISFDIEHTFAADFNVRLIIEDHAGNHVRTVDNPAFPYIWDTTDSAGKPVPDGIYTVHARANDGISFCGTKPARFTILR